MPITFDLPISGAVTRRIYGTSLADRLNGTSGNDYFDGKAGVDTMMGGAGDDWYIVDSSMGETIVEAAGKGIDTVISWASRYTLPSNVENMEQRGTYNSWMTGNSLDNRLKGNDFVNVISGGAGRDILIGGGRRDDLTGGAGNDIFTIERLTDAGDKINDFTVGEDLLDFRLLTKDSAGRLNIKTSQLNTIVELDGTELATLVNVLPKSLAIGRDILTGSAVKVTYDGVDASAPQRPHSAATATSIERPPLMSDAWNLSWGADRGLAPQHLFWENVYDYANPQHMVQTRDVAAMIEKAGKVPVIGMQGWPGIFEASLPGGTYASLDGHKAWATWLQKRPEYLGASAAGEIWGATAGNPMGWGYVSPLMPLNAPDNPAGFSGGMAYYADWIADRLGRLAAHTGTSGFNMADFYDGHPYTAPINFFNLRMVEDFSRKTGILILGASLKEKAALIQSKYSTEYVDYFVNGWSYGWKALAESIERHTGKEALITTQVSFTPAAMHDYAAVDVRALGKQMDLSNLLLNVQTLERFTMQHKQASASYEVAMIGTHAARAPDGHFGHMLTADEDQYRSAVDAMYPNVSDGAQKELGTGRLKETWLQSGWTHIAGNDGDVRRAAEVWQRSYHDLGSVDESWLDVLRDVVPTKPFGPAIYYSVNAEREKYSIETNGNVIGNAYLGELLEPITKLHDAGVTAGYYVSDSALPAIQGDAIPTAWIIPQRYYAGHDLFSTTEIAALQAKAPVLVGNEALNHHFPLHFSENDPDAQITGYGFYDQHERLVVVASDRIDFDDTGTREPVDVKIELDLRNGHYQATNLFNGDMIGFDVSDGIGSFHVTIDRWDTIAFAIVP